MKYFSMFTGVGGFELGITQAYENLFNEMELRRCGQTEGQLETIMSNTISQSNIGQHATCVGFSEIDKYASQLLSIKWPHIKNYGDATKINERELPDFDLLCGGFPCQSFSIAGKRKGFDDTRGTLFFDIARILSYKKPRYLLLENVKGLLSHAGGNTFQTILRVLTDLGYFVEWQVLNSKNFGVPQNRERVFIIGYSGGEPRQKVFPIGGANEKDTRIIGEDVAYTIDANYHKGTNTLEKGRRSLVKLNNPTHSNDRVYGEEGISPTLNTMQEGRRQPFVAPVLTPDRLEKRQNGRRMKENGEPSFTLTGQDKHGVMVDARIRRLTPLECERLQGFPDNWTKNFSDTQRYKMMGNAVTVNVVKYVVSKLIENI